MQAVTLEVPEPIYLRAKRAADFLAKPVEEMIVNTLDTVLPRVTPPVELDDIPPAIRSEFAAMGWLSNEALQGVANCVMSDASQERLNDLLDEQNRGLLTTEAKSELTGLVNEYLRNVLRRSHAAALLVQRGQTPILNPLPEML
jgi:hypothetical protein